VYFIKYVVGIQQFHKDMKLQIPFSKIATPLDEAMGLLLLENSEYRWHAEFEMKVKQHLECTKNSSNQQQEQLKNKKDDMKADLPSTKYTTVGPSKQKKGMTKKYGGWKKSGIDRFNELLAMVRKDRADNGKWFDSYFQENHQKQKDNQMMDGCEKENEDNILVLADNDLFDDDEEEEENNNNTANLDGWNGVSRAI
jgi:hypothetical protein